MRYERMLQVSEKSKGKGKRNRLLTILNGIHANLYNRNSSRTIHMNSTKAEKLLGWKRKVDFDSLVREMVGEDLKASSNLIENQN